MIKIVNFLKQKLLSVQSYKNVNIKHLKKTNKEIVIFDRLSGRYLLNFFKDKNIFFIDVPGERRSIEHIYISFSLIKTCIIEFLKGNISLCYWIALIKEVNPKLIITFSDNNYDFHKLSKVLSKQYKFLTVQNAYRDESYLSELKAKNTFIQNYICFGKQTIDHFNQIGFNVQKFHIAGSLRQYLAEKEIKKINEIQTFDIGLISENLPVDNDPVYTQRIISLKTIAENVRKYSLENNLSVVILLKRDPNSDRGKREINFYKKIFFDLNNISFTTTKDNEFANYHTVYNCNIIIGSRSTLLLEAFAKGKKILVCNYKQDFNIKINAQKKYNRYIELNSLIDPEYFLTLNNRGYDNFKRKIDYLISMKNNEYLVSSKKLRDYMLYYDSESNTFEKINRIIKECLN